MAYKVAVIGAGGIAGNHLHAIQSMARLQAVGIADIAEERAQKAASEFNIHAYTDYREMVRKESPDIAVITLPHYLHKEAAIWCAAQGCHIMLEKPMALNAEECSEIIEAAASSRVKLMVGHTQHYMAENMWVKEIIREGTLGSLVMIQDTRHVHYYRPERPAWFFEKAKAGGGIFMNLGSHSVDKIQWLTGSRITKVRASISHYGTKGDIEGSGMAFVETSSGIPATICQSGYGGVNKNETELIFTNGMLKLAAGQGLWISEQGEYKRLDFNLNQSEKPFVLQFQDLIRSIENDEEPACSGNYGKSVISAVEAIYRSCFKGGEVML